MDELITLARGNTKLACANYLRQRALAFSGDLQETLFTLAQDMEDNVTTNNQ